MQHETENTLIQEENRGVPCCDCSALCQIVHCVQILQIPTLQDKESAMTSEYAGGCEKLLQEDIC